MESNNDRFTQLLLYVAVIAGIGMLVLGFTMPGSMYIDICGAVCGIAVFFLLSDPDILGIDKKMNIFRFADVAWVLYSAYKIYTKSF